MIFGERMEYNFLEWVIKNVGWFINIMKEIYDGFIMYGGYFGLDIFDY